MTLDEFAAIVWTRLDVTKKTLYNYMGGYRRYVAPKLGARELADIGSVELRDCLISLPSQSRYQTHMMLRTIFREALNEGLIDRHPMEKFRAPRVSPKSTKFLTWEEIASLDFGFFTNRVRFLALHGLRYGEAAALTDSDIYDGYVHVTKSIHGQTKTAAGVRKVPYLGYFEKFPKKQCKMGVKLRKHGVTVHSLRKTYAYSLKTSNVHVTTAARLLGHANPMVTLKIYTGVRDDEIAASKEQLIRGLNLGAREQFKDGSAQSHD